MKHDILSHPVARQIPAAGFLHALFKKPLNKDTKLQPKWSRVFFRRYDSKEYYLLQISHIYFTKNITSHMV